LKHWNGLEDKGAATAGSHGYTNAAKSLKKDNFSSPSPRFDPDSGPSVEERLETMEKAFLNAAKSTPSPEGGQSKRKKPFFCDNHGWCMHESKNCRDIGKGGKKQSHNFPKKKEPNGK
jgi:hypothetical protein